MGEHHSGLLHGDRYQNLVSPAFQFTSQVLANDFRDAVMRTTV